MKKNYVKVYHNDDDNEQCIYVSLADAFDSELDGFNLRGETGSKITFEVIEMDENEFLRLEEFAGWQNRKRHIIMKKNYIKVHYDNDGEQRIYSTPENAFDSEIIEFSFRREVGSKITFEVIEMEEDDFYKLPCVMKMVALNYTL